MKNVEEPKVVVKQRVVNAVSAWIVRQGKKALIESFGGADCNEILKGLMFAVEREVLTEDDLKDFHPNIYTLYMKGGE